MEIKKYDELNSFQMDVFKELGSIGSGNAATALSSLLEYKISMTVPEVRILENNEAVARLGGPERIVAAILVTFSGSINGIILYLQSLEYINNILSRVLDKTVEDFSKLDDIDISALTEIGNIMMSSYINAIAQMTGMTIEMSPPAMTVNMLGAVLSVPMTEFGYEADKLMIVDGSIVLEGRSIESNLIMMPDVQSLNTILRMLGVLSE